MSWREMTVDADAALDDDFGRGKAHCMTCGSEWFGLEICHCTVCHLTFTSIRPFDEHRLDGRCRTPSELSERGLEPNEAGHWRRPMDKKALERRLRGAQSG